VHQAVLVHAHVDERAERGHVGDLALQQHPGLQVGDLVHALGEHRGAERRARVAAGLLQLAEDVGDRRQPELRVDEPGRLERLELGGVADQLGDVQLRGLQDAVDHRVGLRVHAGDVQRVLAAADAQEAGALLERLRTQPRHVGERAPRAERVVRVAVHDDLGGQRLGDARHPAQQRHRGGVDVHADGVHAVLHHGVQ